MRKPRKYTARFYFLIALLLLGFAAILWRLIDLAIFNRHFLVQQSNARALRVIAIPAYRGMMMDRDGTPLAISTPVDSVWMNPQMFQATREQINQLAHLLGLKANQIKQQIQGNTKREFIYLKRGVPPDIAGQVKELGIPGIFFQREYRRYYPEGEVAAHVVGFTNVDDSGQEGLELAYDSWLRGVQGKEQVLKDRLGHIIAILNVTSQPVQGRDLILSIDDRIQYIAYQSLQNAIQINKADSGSVVVMNVKTGEILAMANIPSFNPNERPLNVNNGNSRNRAVTDVFEPGSTMKTFSMASALESGKYTATSLIDTNPGWIIISGHKITDDEPNNGVISLTRVLQLSSNIGAAKITLSLPPERLRNFLQRFGFGQLTQSGFPGEVPGTLMNYSRWRPIDLATLSFGYGVSVTALQLAHAYAAIANQGVMMPVTFLRRDEAVTGKQIITPALANQIMQLLETVVTSGTASAAAIPGYLVAGKTGTAYIAGPNGYDPNHRSYTSTFVGIAPASNPQLVVAVILRNPQGSQHMGGQIAAPAFQTIMSAALRILNIPPDNVAVIPAPTSVQNSG